MQVHTMATTATRKDGAYTATCTCGWEVVSLELAASPDKNRANVARSVRSHLRGKREARP